MPNNMRALMEAVLMEGVRYEDMFEPLRHAIEQSLADPTDIIRDIDDDIKGDVLWAKRVLRKSDRITWYLKKVRADICDNFHVLDYTAKLHQRYEKETGVSWESDRKYFQRSAYTQVNLMDALDHFMTLPIAFIQNYQFRNQSIEQVRGDFEEAENAWKKEAGGTVTAEPEDKIILDFKDGWVWIMLDRASCPAEADAMGHCGNSPRSLTADRILSLRKKIEAGGVVRWSPHLTFILRKDGMLTEMKGRGNDKPSEKYRPMIIGLLKLPIIKGIVGGGYLAQNNFSLNDLTPEQQEELTSINPNLLSAYQYGRKIGMDEHFNEKLHAEYQSFVGRYCEVEDGIVYFDRPTNLNSFLSHIYIEDLKPVVNIFNLDFDNLPTVSDMYIIEGLYRDAYEALRREDQAIMTLQDSIARNKPKMEKAITRVEKVCERKATEYIRTYIGYLNFDVSLVYAKMVGEKVFVAADAMELASALKDYSLGNEDGEADQGYYDINRLAQDGPFVLADNYDDGYSDNATPEEFIQELNEEIKSFWIKLFRAIILKA